MTKGGDGLHDGELTGGSEDLRAVFRGHRARPGGRDLLRRRTAFGVVAILSILETSLPFDNAAGSAGILRFSVAAPDWSVPSPRRPKGWMRGSAIARLGAVDAGLDAVARRRPGPDEVKELLPPRFVRAVDVQRPSRVGGRKRNGSHRDSPRPYRSCGPPTADPGAAHKWNDVTRHGPVLPPER